MTLAIDHSGNVRSKKKPTIKDILVNREAWDSVERKNFVAIKVEFQT